ncbi:MAG: hypothetical protein WCO38_05735 [Verrucomicrobiota bacterium]
MSYSTQTRSYLAWVLVFVFAFLAIYEGAFYLRESFKVSSMNDELSLTRLELQSARNTQEAQAILHAREVLDLKDYSNRLRLDLLSSRSKKAVKALGIVAWDPLTLQGVSVISQLPVLKSGMSLVLTYTSTTSTTPQFLGNYKLDETKHEARLYFHPHELAATGHYCVRLIGVVNQVQNPEGSLILQSL